MVLTAVLGGLHYLEKTVNDSDFVDRLHSFLTANILLAMSILVSYKQFGGQPVECMVPDMFTSAWEQYAENYCWAQDTYFLPFNEQVPKEIADRKDRNISYYQWVPFFLLIEAACFRLPSLIWKYLAGHSGIKIHDIVKLAIDEKNVEPECKKANIRSLTVHLQNALRFHRRLYKKNITPHRILRFLNLPYSAFFVTTMYLVTKLLYLLNVCLQLYFLNLFLETDDNTMFGLSVVNDMLNGTTWQHSGVFPRVRVMGNVQRYSVQCVLVINIFNEKIFIFLWFWYMILMALTAVSFCYWVCVSILPIFSRWFISRHLELSEMPFDPKSSQKDVERFVASYLKTDGIFVLRMITMHSGIIFGTDLVLSLWKSFYGIEEMCRRSESTELKPITADILTPTPTSAHGMHNKLNFLRLRFRNNKNGDGKDSDDNHNNAGGDGGKDSDGDDSFTKRLIPPPPPSAPPKIGDGGGGDQNSGEHPQQSLDLPDGGAFKGGLDRSRAPSLSERRGSDLRITMPPSTTRDEDYTTARTVEQSFGTSSNPTSTLPPPHAVAAAAMPHDITSVQIPNLNRGTYTPGTYNPNTIHMIPNANPALARRELARRHNQTPGGGQDASNPFGRTGGGRDQRRQDRSNFRQGGGGMNADRRRR